MQSCNSITSYMANKINDPMTDPMETLKYPIGRYTTPEAYTTDDINNWINAISALPMWMDACIENLDVYQLETPYRPGGWTVQQVVHHVADSHMNAYIRLKLALTEDNPTIAPYREELWAEMEDTKTVPVNVSVTMLHALHRRMVAILKQLQPADWQRTYFHPQYKRSFPLWEMVALYAWHGRHHAAHIRTLREQNNW